MGIRSQSALKYNILRVQAPVLTHPENIYLIQWHKCLPLLALQKRKNLKRYSFNTKSQDCTKF